MQWRAGAHHTGCMQLFVTQQQEPIACVQQFLDRQQGVVGLNDDFSTFVRPDGAAQAKGGGQAIVQFLGNTGAKASTSTAGEALQEQEAPEMIASFSFKPCAVEYIFSTPGAVLVITQGPIIT
jgi:hypothetical protein